MPAFNFVTIWRLDAPIEAVWGPISAPEGYPSWWPYVRRSDKVRPAGADGVGAVYRMTFTTTLRYRFHFDGRITRVEPPSRLELVATGDLIGTGTWTLWEEQGTTAVQYEWSVDSSIDWFNRVARIRWLAPLLNWNHNEVMRVGGEGVARVVGARLLGMTHGGPGHR